MAAIETGTEIDGGLVVDTHAVKNLRIVSRPSDSAPGEIPNIRVMYNDIEHSISIDFYI
jgi:hypothetical protein